MIGFPVAASLVSAIRVAAKTARKYWGMAALSLVGIGCGVIHWIEENTSAGGWAICSGLWVTLAMAWRAIAESLIEDLRAEKEKSRR